MPPLARVPAAAATGMGCGDSAFCWDLEVWGGGNRLNVFFFGRAALYPGAATGASADATPSPHLRTLRPGGDGDGDGDGGSARFFGGISTIPREIILTSASYVQAPVQYPTVGSRTHSPL